MNSQSHQFDPPKVLIGYSACPLTREAFELAGCVVWTCDLLPARDGNTNRHLQCDVWQALQSRSWSAAVLHPMCTYLTVSAAWAYSDPDFVKYPNIGYHQRVKPATLVGAARRAARRAALENFEQLMKLPFPVAIENPAPSFISTAICKPTQIIQPHQFGDDASKSTGLWLNSLPPLLPTKKKAGRMVVCNGKHVERWGNQTNSGQNKVTPSDERWLERSKTYPGIAAAMGEQWGGFLVRNASQQSLVEAA